MRRYLVMEQSAAPVLECYDDQYRKQWCTLAVQSARSIELVRIIVLFVKNLFHIIQE
jgi:hypothetical protein